DRRTHDDAAILNIVDSLLAPRIPIDDPQPALLRDAVQVDAELPEFIQHRIGRLRRDSDKAARARLQPFSEEREGEPKFLLARRPLEDDARSDRQAALDHLIESQDPQRKARHGSGLRRLAANSETKVDADSPAKPGGRQPLGDVPAGPIGADRRWASTGGSRALLGAHQAGGDDRAAQSSHKRSLTVGRESGPLAREERDRQ